MKAFMNSRTAAALDDTYDRLQWAGQEYILDELNDEVGGLKKAGITFTKEVMFWTGYTYRAWRYCTGESSKEIYRQASAKTMDDCWMGFHTMDVEPAIEDLKEIYKEEHSH